MPARNPVRRDHYQIDVLALNYIENIPDHVISNFDKRLRLDSSASEDRMTLRQMPLYMFPCLMQKRLFRNKIGKSCHRKEWNDIDEKEFGMEVLSKVRCHL